MKLLRTPNLEEFTIEIWFRRDPAYDLTTATQDEQFYFFETSSGTASIYIEYDFTNSKYMLVLKRDDLYSRIDLSSNAPSLTSDDINWHFMSLACLDVYGAWWNDYAACIVNLYPEDV
jgi:hypothetical protein